MKQKTSGLFRRAIISLSVVSVVPVLLIGWHVLRMNNHLLQGEILEKQRTVATRIAFLISETISRQMQFITIFTEVHSEEATHLPFISKQDLDYVRRHNPEITHLSVLNNKGRQLFYSSEKGNQFNYALELGTILQTCVTEGKEYIGTINHQNGQLFALLAFPLRLMNQPHEIYGVLVSEINLAELGHALEQVYSENMFAAVAAPDGNLISYSGAPDGLAPAVDMPLRRQLQDIKRSMNKRADARVTLEDGQSLLVSQAAVPVLGWTVFVYQPDNLLGKQVGAAVFNSTFNMGVILLASILFIWLVAYWVLRPIIRPVQQLKNVAVQLEQRDDYIPTEKDLVIPDNEIGELAHVFLHMVSVLAERRESLRLAQHNLSAINEELEVRVQQRTAELEQASAKLVKSERLVAIGQMASIISHEIRNPLAVITNATKLIQMIQPPKDPKIIKQFSIIESEIRQANSIISEVLGFARSRNMILSLVDLNSYLHEIVQSFPAPTGIKVVEKFDKKSERFKIDTEEIKQAMRNLITNACESMPEGGQVTVGTKIGKNIICIFVADEGPGISAQLKENIFSPFFTTKARGTGLGLAVVSKAISRHKGKLFVHNRPDKGAVFEIYLRIYRKPGDTNYG